VQVLQALQHGANHHPRVSLGADEIARMQAAKAAPSATKLELWLRASLNEQLLGIRLSMLAGSVDALAHYYHPAALLLQHHALAAVMQAVSALSEHRFALPVELQAPAAAAGGSGSVIGQQQQQQSHANVVPTSRSATVAAALDPRKLLSGLASARLGPLRGGSATATPAAAAAAPVTAGVPTFLWGGGSSSNSSQAATTTAGPGPESTAASSGGGFFQRRGQQQRVAPLATKPAGAGLAREPSAQLSPVSTADEAAYAEWWQDSGQEQPAGVVADGPGSNAGSGSMSSSLPSQPLGTGASGELAVVSPSAAADGRHRSSSEEGGSTSPSGATSAAALKIEADLTAAMLSPTASRRSVDGAGAQSLRSSSGGGGSGGWDAAVARARSVEAAHSGGGRRPCHMLKEQQPE
jgi:hypothetical protein